MQDNLSGGCKRVAAAILNFFKLSISDHREEKERPKWQHPLGCFISCMVRRELELQKWRHAQVGASGGNHRRHAPSPLDAHFSWMPHFSGCHPPCGSQSSQQQERPPVLPPGFLEGSCRASHASSREQDGRRGDTVRRSLGDPQELLPWVLQ